VPKRRRNNRGQASQRQNINRVVVKNGNQPGRFLVAQIIKIHKRNQVPRQIAFALHAQNLLLQLNQFAAFQPQLPQPPRPMQQIQMPHAPKWRLRPVHAKARLQQRLIITLAVVSDQHLKLAQMRFQRRQLAPLLRKLAHKKLPHAKPVARNPPHANQERISPAPARQPRRLCVQKRPPLRRNAAYLAVAQHIQKRVGQLTKRAHIGRPMRLMPGKQALRLIMRPKLVLHHCAVRPFLNPAPPRPNHRRGIRILGIDQRDALPQTG